ncbi:MAG: hypothetical protein R3266_09390, partial [Gemmatimonadota bacterium]|nr:hypothetical protein [Gemmatimonadota bacterium]
AVEGLADLAYARGDWDRARELYEAILAEAHPDLSLRLAEVAEALGDDDAAARHERTFLRLATAPGAEALNAHGLAIYYASRPETRDDALAVIERDLERRRSGESLEVVAWVRLERGELDLALEASDEARGWGAPDATSDYVRGRILIGLGSAEEGRELVASALAEPTLLAHHVLAERRAR